MADRAAQKWANYANADQHVNVTWRYLLASEGDSVNDG